MSLFTETIDKYFVGKVLTGLFLMWSAGISILALMDLQVVYRSTKDHSRLQDVLCYGATAAVCGTFYYLIERARRRKESGQGG